MQLFHELKLYKQNNKNKINQMKNPSSMGIEWNKNVWMGRGWGCNWEVSCEAPGFVPSSGEEGRAEGKRGESPHPQETRPSLAWVREQNKGKISSINRQSKGRLSSAHPITQTRRENSPAGTPKDTASLLSIILATGIYPKHVEGLSKLQCFSQVSQLR